MTAGAEEPALLMPAAYDVVWSLVVLAAGVLLLVALVRWFRTGGPAGGRLLDVLVIVLLPVVGPAAYLLGQRSRVGAGGGDDARR